jgi:hypothetical protein
MGDNVPESAQLAANGHLADLRAGFEALRRL